MIIKFLRDSISLGELDLLLNNDIMLVNLTPYILN